MNQAVGPQKRSRNTIRIRMGLVLIRVAVCCSPNHQITQKHTKKRPIISLLTRMRMSVHLCQRMAQRQHWTLRRSDNVQQLVIVIVHHILPGLRIQMTRRPRTGHMRWIQFVGIGTALRHQRLSAADRTRKEVKKKHLVRSCAESAGEFLCWQCITSVHYKNWPRDNVNSVSVA